MTFPVYIYEVVSSVPALAPLGGNNITLNVDDVYHAVIGATLMIGGKPYTIVSWNENYNLQDEIMQLVVNDSTGVSLSLSFTATETFTCSSIIPSGSNYVITGTIGATPPISGLPASGSFLLSGGAYTVINSTTILAVGGTITSTISANSFNFYAPFFAHGTIQEEESQLLQQPSTWNKYPLIWAKEGVKERFFNDRDDSHERESDLTIYFLTDSNFELPNPNIYDLYVRPMTRLKDNFIKILNTETGNFPIGAIDRDDMTIDTTEITKVSVSIRAEKTKSTLFADKVSGVAIEFKLKLLQPENNIFGQQPS